jgi:hypothetical protein
LEEGRIVVARLGMVGCTAGSIAVARCLELFAVADTAGGSPPVGSGAAAVRQEIQGMHGIADRQDPLKHLTASRVDLMVAG